MTKAGVRKGRLNESLRLGIAMIPSLARATGCDLSRAWRPAAGAVSKFACGAGARHQPIRRRPDGLPVRGHLLRLRAGLGPPPAPTAGFKRRPTRTHAPRGDRARTLRPPRWVGGGGGGPERTSHIAPRASASESLRRPRLGYRPGGGPGPAQRRRPNLRGLSGFFRCTRSPFAYPRWPPAVAGPPPAGSRRRRSSGRPGVARPGPAAAAPRTTAPAAVGKRGETPRGRMSESRRRSSWARSWCSWRCACCGGCGRGRGVGGAGAG